MGDNDKDKEEDKEDKTRDDKIGSSTIFNAMMADKAEDKQLMRDLMSLEKSLTEEMFKIRLDMIKQAEVRSNEVKGLIQKVEDERREHTRAVDRDHHEKRSELKAELIERMDEDKITSFKQLILSPKLFKEWGAAVAAVVMGFFIMFGGKEAPKEEPKVNSKEKPAIEAIEEPEDTK